MTDNGLTKSWVRPNGDRVITYHEGGYGPLVFTVRLKWGWLPVWGYVAIRAFGRWFRAHGGTTFFPTTKG